MWFITAEVPFVCVALLITLITGYLGGRMVISRVTASTYKSNDSLLVIGLVLPIIGAAFFQWSEGLHLAWSIGLLAYLSFRIVCNFFMTTLRLEGYLKRREFLSVAVHLTRWISVRI